MQFYVSSTVAGRLRICLMAFLTALLVAAMVAVARAAQGAKPLPVFAIDKTERDFGDVFLGEDLVQVFYVRNLGAAALELSESPIIAASPRTGSYRTGDSLQSRLLPVGFPLSLAVNVAGRVSAPT